MKTGKEIQAALVEKGINALWIKGRGMVIMSNHYGTDVAVSGKYRLISLATCKEILAGTETIEHAEYVAYSANRQIYEVR